MEIDRASSEDHEGYAHKAAQFIENKARAAAEARKSRVVESVNRIGDAFDSAADSLQRSGVGKLDEYSRTVAGKLRRVSSGLEQRDVGDLASDVAGFVRRNPVLFIGGAFLGGALVGLLLRRISPVNGVRVAESAKSAVRDPAGVL